MSFIFKNENTNYSSIPYPNFSGSKSYHSIILLIKECIIKNDCYILSGVNIISLMSFYVHRN